MKVDVAGELFELLPQKALYWPRVKSLLIADAHLGKISHFRKSGIPLPAKANDRNIELLVELIQQLKPSRVLFLGDLFHSHYNPEWEVFGEVVKHFRPVSFELISGNHDIMSSLQYERKGIRVHEQLIEGPIVLTHHPKEPDQKKHQELYNLAGHIHPGVSLHGKGRQALTLPCFHFGKKLGLLPAFGVFTGLAKIRPVVNDKVYVIVENRILDVNQVTC